MSEPTAPDEPEQVSSPETEGEPSSHETAGQFPADEVRDTHDKLGAKESTESTDDTESSDQPER